MSKSINALLRKASARRPARLDKLVKPAKHGQVLSAKSKKPTSFRVSADLTRKQYKLEKARLRNERLTKNAQLYAKRSSNAAKTAIVGQAVSGATGVGVTAVSNKDQNQQSNPGRIESVKVSNNGTFDITHKDGRKTYTTKNPLKESSEGSVGSAVEQIIGPQVQGQIGNNESKRDHQ